MKTPGFWGTLKALPDPVLPPLLGVTPTGREVQVVLAYSMQIYEVSIWC